MPSQHTDPQAVLQLLGVSAAEVEGLRNLPYPDACTKLEALKERVRKNWRRLAFELHPDRTGNDPDKTALFRALALMRERFEQMTLPVPVYRTATARPPVQPTTQHTAHQTPPTPGVVFRAPRPQPPKPMRPNVGFVTATMKP